jgi:hypothetical protein
MAFNESKVDLYGWNLERHSRITLAQLLISADRRRRTRRVGPGRDFSGPADLASCGLGRRGSDQESEALRHRLIPFAPVWHFNLTVRAVSGIE